MGNIPYNYGKDAVHLWEVSRTSMGNSHTETSFLQFLSHTRKANNRFGLLIQEKKHQCICRKPCFFQDFLRCLCSPSLLHLRQTNTQPIFFRGKKYRQAHLPTFTVLNSTFPILTTEICLVTKLSNIVRSFK